MFWGLPDRAMCIFMVTWWLGEEVIAFVVMAVWFVIYKVGLCTRLVFFPVSAKDQLIECRTDHETYFIPL